MKIIYCDSLIIGGGLAGLRSAVACAEKGLNTIVLSLVPVKRSHSAAAQGGMQSSLANSKKSEGDSEDIHFADTVKGSDWGCDQKVARMFAQTAPKAVRELAAWGVPWTRIKKGPRQSMINQKWVTIEEDDETHGLIAARDFGGTHKWRTSYTADATGHTMLYTVANQAMKHDVTVHDRKEAIALIHENNRCYGAIVRDLITGEIYAYVSKGTMIATGGYGRIYEITTNAVICEGIGHAIALETGIARLGNMEALQFHPTPLFPIGILLSEACRGDGGVLRDKNGHRFMPDYEPEKMDLASRDVVSRRMIEHIRKGNGVDSPYGPHLWLDISILGREHIERNLRDVQDICKAFVGIDPANEGPRGWAPVRPSHHYSMGGIRTKPTGESPTLAGLFCAGEASCWDMHGFNRLGGNSVAETVVSGMIVGNYFADHCLENEIDISTAVIRRFLDEQRGYMNDLLVRTGDEDIHQIKRKMKSIMQEKVGVFRNGSELEQAIRELTELMERSQHVRLTHSNHATNPHLEEAYRVPKMLKVALCAAKGALERQESRGAHTREDFPKRDDANWLCRTLAYWNQGDTLPSLEYEPLDVKSMEMPPGYRGYGAKDNMIPHPDTAARQEEVDAIKARMESEGKDRFEIQDALMPYELQPEFKAKNVRKGSKA